MKDTSWGGVADWYDDLLTKTEGTYQKEVILPNLLRAMEIKKGEKVLDLACGQGFFSREFAKAGAEVLGLDISPELIKIASLQTTNYKLPAVFKVAPADNLKSVPDSSMDKAAIVLAIQNIENLMGTMAECARVLKKGGKLFIVMNHPVFRIPKASSWGWDEEKKMQYRQLDAYMSESREKIDMHPGEKSRDYTISFHRPLQVYFKAMRKAGFAVRSLEEWISGRVSQPGPRAKAENAARAEFPLFLFWEAVKY